MQSIDQMVKDDIENAIKNNTLEKLTLDIVMAEPGYGSNAIKKIFFSIIEKEYPEYKDYLDKILLLK